jgi:hypothetical protein
MQGSHSAQAISTLPPCRNHIHSGACAVVSKACRAELQVQVRAVSSSRASDTAAATSASIAHMYRASRQHRYSPIG